MRAKFIILLGFFVASFSLLLARLIDVALVQGQHFFNLAEDNRYFIKKNPAERGIFLDRYHQALVKNERQYFRHLQEDRLYSDKIFLTRDEALSFLASESANLGYELSRVYPYREALSSVLGYLSPVSEEDLQANAQLSLNSRVGSMGLEQFFDHQLQAQASSLKFETNALGQKQRLVAEKPAVYGQNIETALDPYLSQVAYQAMAGKKGAVIIMDASNGELLALVNSPSFDANLFEEHYLNNLYHRDRQSSLSKITQYLQDERQVFFNRSLSGTYPPGSVFKLITALAALEEGVIDEKSVVDDQGTLKVGDYAYANWYFTQYGRVEGSVNVQKALARSNDIFFYKAAEWLGPSKLAEYARLFGLGSPTGVQSLQEASGLVPDPVWKENQKGETWYLGNTYHFGIGQGDLLVTPLQVANFTQAIANRGVFCPSSLLPITQQNCRDLLLEQKNLDLVLRGMLDACSTGGTAYPLFTYNQNIAAALAKENAEFDAEEKISRGMIACKTGTAEFGAADARGYRQTHAWITAIVGMDPNQWSTSELETATDPQRVAWLNLLKAHGFPKKIVITVLVESDSDKIYSEGSQDAAPVVAQILTWIRGV